VLVQQRLPCRRHLRFLLREGKPRHHPHRLPVPVTTAHAKCR
jgi:hypothetical protein